MPNFFKVMSLPEVRNKKHPFWRNYKEKRNIYES